MHATLSPGDTIGPLTSPDIARMNIAYMAVAMRDPNPVHTEDEFAQQAGLPRVIAHGTFPLGYVGALLTQTFGFDRVRSWQAALVAPVFPHDCLRVTGTVREQQGDELRVDLQVVNRDDTVVARGSATVRTGSTE